MSARQPEANKLLAALNEQRAALGEMALMQPPLAAPALGRACAEAVLAAADAGLEPTRDALRAAVRFLLDVLAERAPGRAVEVRVPPLAAVQAIGGPRHTRGTPPNVVETDPVTWVRLATGRLSWAEATGAGRVNASGPRADLSPYMPVLPLD